MGSAASSLLLEWKQALGWATTASLATAALMLILPILWPTIISYPWKLPSSTRQQARDKRRVVVLAGSYNPPHYGHLAMLEYLASRYGKVVAVVGMNPDKTYQVTPDERASLIRRMVQESDYAKNITVEVVQGYIWRRAKRQGWTIFFRGIRSWEKDGRDERSLQILNTWGPLVLGPVWWPLPTIYLEGKPEYNHISSSLIRELCGKKQKPEEALAKLVPEKMAKSVLELYSRPCKVD